MFLSFFFSFFTWVLAIFLFFLFLPTIETLDVIVRNEMKLKQLVWNHCNVFNLWQMSDLSKLSAVSDFSLNSYAWYKDTFAVICAVLTGYSAAWGTEEFLSMRCWNSVELFIHLYLFTKYCGIFLFPYSFVLQESSRQVFLCIGINLLICRSNFYKRDKVVLQVFALFLVSFPCLQQVVLPSLTLPSAFVGVTE